MPIGYLVTTALVALSTWLALVPLRHPPALGAISFRLGVVIDELPFLAFYYLLASTLLAIAQGDIDSPAGWAGLGLAVLATAGLVAVVRRGLLAGPAVDRAVNDGLGVSRRPRRLPGGRVLFAPFLFRRRDVERVANIAYGGAGRRNLLDLYLHRGHPRGGPILIHLHGGRFTSGRKSREARPLLYRLASRGWVCISANYRLSPAAGFPDQLVDVKKVIGWAREHGHEYGADPAVVFVAGSSAGGHLASLAALTANEPALQPGFEQLDTSVAAAICLYGYYGRLDSDGDLPSSPLAYGGATAPPFFVAHGDRDTVVPVEGARLLVDHLRSTSPSPVVYAELPGAQHAFDLFHSIRFEMVIDGIEAFTAAVRSRGLMQA